MLISNKAYLCRADRHVNNINFHMKKPCLKVSRNFFNSFHPTRNIIISQANCLLTGSFSLNMPISSLFERPLRTTWNATGILTETLWWPGIKEKMNDPKGTLVLFVIPGNPGVIEYYK